MSDSVDLRPLLRQIDQMGQQLSSSIDSVGTEVGYARQDIRLTSGELAQLRSEFETFKAAFERTANVQRSETKIGTLRDELDRAFGHYAIVRRTSTGTLQAFDVGNVSNATVTAVSEELMLQTPRYWLAPALVTLAAWSRDNPDMAERSIKEAYSRDRNKTSLFFALVMRRQGRQQAALAWLRHYIEALDPTTLTREFAIILEASSYGAFGPQGQDLVGRSLSTWMNQLRQNPKIVDDQVKKWGAEIGVQREALNDTELPALRKIATDFTSLQRQLDSASALPRVIEKYQAVRAHNAPLPTHLEDILDDILDELVTEYDDEELPLRREVAYHEAVIDENGDLNRASQRAALVQEALGETTDVVSLQTMAAVQPDTLGVSVQTQRIAIGVGQADFRAAAGTYCATYRAAASRDYTYNLTEKHSNYANNYSFQGCTVTSHQPEDQAIATITKAWEDTFRSPIEALKFTNGWYIKRGVIAAVICIVLLAINPLAGIVGLLIAGGGIYLLGDKERERRATEIAKLEKARTDATHDSIAVYRDANAELVDALIMYDEFDSHEPDLLRLIDTWPTANSNSNSNSNTNGNRESVA